jgi:transposase
MRVLHERCCGLDIQKKSVVACLLTTGPDGTVQKEVRTSSTMTNELLALADWLREAACGPVVMESTGSYWRPVFNLLEGQCVVFVVNAQHSKAVPGRKTDVKDAEWLADLLRHGRHARQLHSGAGPASPARPDPLAHSPRGRAGPAHQPASSRPGRRQ